MRKGITTLQVTSLLFFTILISACISYCIKDGAAEERSQKLLTKSNLMCVDLETDGIQTYVHHRYLVQQFSIKDNVVTAPKLHKTFSVFDCYSFDN